MDYILVLILAGARYTMYDKLTRQKHHVVEVQWIEE